MNTKIEIKLKNGNTVYLETNRAPIPSLWLGELMLQLTKHEKAKQN